MKGKYGLFRFVECGSIGWCMEVIWTGLGSLIHHNKKLTGTSSLFMFPIYGCAVIIEPLHELFKKSNFFIRGSVYAACIFATEFISGSLLKKIDACPWDYSHAKYNYKGVIRLDYAPVWFTVGLIYEQILGRQFNLPSVAKN